MPNPFASTEKFLRSVAKLAVRKGLHGLEFTAADIGDHYHVYGVNAHRRTEEFLDKIVRKSQKCQIQIPTNS